MYNWKFYNVTKEQLESMEDVQIETVATIKERIYPDNAGNGMPQKQHWFTKEMTTLVKYYVRDIENKIYYYAFVVNDYEIRELTLSKDNWNEYNILLDEGTEEEVQEFLIDCFDNVWEDDFNDLQNQEEVESNGDINISLDGMEKLIGEIETHLIEKLKS